MKTKKQNLHLPRIFILIILICVVVSSLSLTAGSLKQMMEYNTDEAFPVFDGWLNEFKTAGEGNINFNISTNTDENLPVKTDDVLNELEPELIGELTDDYEYEFILIEENTIQCDIEQIAAETTNTITSSATTITGNTSSSNSNSSNTGNSNTGSSNNSGSSDSSPPETENKPDTGNTPPAAENKPDTDSTPPAAEEKPDTGHTLPAPGNNNYPSISSNCRDILARLVKLEAPNEGADGKQAVAEVVLNRMVSSRWSHVTTVEEVVFDDKWGVQFTVKDLIWTERGTPSSADYAAVDRALSGPNVLTKDYMFFTSRPRTQDVLWIGNHAFSK